MLDEKNHGKLASSVEMKKEAAEASLMNHTKLEVKLNKMAFGAYRNVYFKLRSNDTKE